MLNYVLSLNQIRVHDAKRVGNKAMNLSRLARAGFPVPQALCITTEALWAALGNRRYELERIIGKFDLRDPEQAQIASKNIDETLSNISVPRQIIAALGTFIERSVPLAVRSSSTAEDQASTSYAGVYATTLGVRGADAVQESIVDCWRSFFEPGALVARAVHGGLGHEQAMAVLIQPLIEAECSGLCFSVDPVQQRRDLIIINAVWGLGPGVVDGVVDSDTYWMHRAGFGIERCKIPEKARQIMLMPEGGTAVSEVITERRKAMCLPAAWARRIAEFSIAIETNFGKPQDIEWAVADQRLWILQSRPITTIAKDVAKPRRFPLRRGEILFWSLVNEYGIDSGPLLPLEQDAIRVVEGIREEACRFMGADRNQEVRFFNGRAYKRPLPVGFAEGDQRIRRQALKDLDNRLHEQRLTAWDYWGPEIVKATERLAAFDFTLSDGGLLAVHLENVLATRRRHFMLHPLCSFNPHPSYFKALEQLLGQPDTERMGYFLLEGEQTPLTWLIDALFELAQCAPPAIHPLIQNPPEDILDQLVTRPDSVAFLKNFQNFLTRFGDLTGDGWGSEAVLSHPSWREHPQDIFRLLGAYLHGEAASPIAVRLRAWQEREALLETLCRRCSAPAVIAEFRMELEYARREATVLEFHNYYIDQLSTGQLRRAVMAAAHWLVQHNILRQPGEIFYLYFTEILVALRSPESVAYAGEIFDRQKQYQAWQKMEAPPIIGVPDAQLPVRPSWADETIPASQLQDRFLEGIGASPGKRQGRARIVHDDVDQLMPGDILVAQNIGPRWTPIFPILGALVLNGGAIGQHAAAAAREYGLPAVIETRFATQRIPDGAQIIVDGTRGVVEILET